MQVTYADIQTTANQEPVEPRHHQAIIELTSLGLQE